MKFKGVGWKVRSWRSVVPFRLRKRFRSGFRKVSSSSSSPSLSNGNGKGNGFSSSSSSSSSPVYLNVYDLTPSNGYIYWFGLGVFHSGVEVHGVEYAFGAHDYPSSGVFEVEPKQCQGFKFRKSVFMGNTSMNPIQVREFMEKHASNYNGNTYHLIVKNCNHFCKDVCFRLTGNAIPPWVNRLAQIGLRCNWLLPAGLRVSDESKEGDVAEEKRRLKCGLSSRLSFITSRPACLFLPSPIKKNGLKLQFKGLNTLEDR
ncbi:deSI-like protein At4g17486 [Amborella trichopoda]|uniref:PPPDE domain-containing protein n=1 Tax=Amborella trichopoda TaxID=13333 RepID=W1P195_AMBTC|nr:deSI-like protein At4g17486 [Amborella trichopoda]ERN00705.1 hypothetical protein AMTR_s00106p00080300 [Amborella trichopoda]|eukprot:XP_006838136.1 deSI-like protein At4g17486 [Amborella trichopoda]